GVVLRRAVPRRGGAPLPRPEPPGPAAGRCARRSRSGDRAPERPALVSETPMAGFKFSDFAAMYPIRDIRRLPDNAATVARNMNPVTGAVEALRAPRAIKGVNPGTRRVFRIPTGAINDLSPASSFWWEFADGDTDVLRTPIVNDTLERYYW